LKYYVKTELIHLVGVGVLALYDVVGGGGGSLYYYGSNA
jgi:hypothetical protein